jgi:uncharacterized protein YhbP (UPF0306 family)
MSLPEKRITDFIRKHHVLTLATSADGIPWCAHCFYVYMEDKNQLVFTSDDQTKHVSDAEKNPEVAGGIVLETGMIGKIQGVQFRGVMRKPEEDEERSVKLAYLKRFPFAALMDTSLWVLELTYIKMTDNRLGFGKKLFWEKAK